MMAMMAICGLLCLTPTAFADPGILSLSGTGSVSVEPDEGYITIGVHTKAENSVSAVKANTKLMTNLFKTLTAFGIERKDFQTIDFRVQQSYKRTVTGGVAHQVPDGFIVVNRLRVTVCDLKNMGEVLDACVKSGANRVQSISFGSSESAKHIDAARKKAVADVKRKAEILTKSLGVNLGIVKRVSESSYQPRNFSRSIERGGSPVPISGGSLTFSINVSVTWELRQEPRSHLIDPFPKKK